jgi:hypothetical protein
MREIDRDAVSRSNSEQHAPRVGHVPIHPVVHRRPRRTSIDDANRGSVSLPAEHEASEGTPERAVHGAPAFRLRDGLLARPEVEVVLAPRDARKDAELAAPFLEFVPGQRGVADRLFG